MATAVAAVVVVCAVIAVAVLRSSGDDDTVARRVAEVISPKQRPEFPAVDSATLPRERARIVEAARVEYDRNAPGTTYSEGVEEPWCADFVSSVMRKAGVPLSNPNSGSWRIPGVATLTEYLHDSGRWRAATHRPVPGDVVLYDVPSHYRQHTNLVVAVNGDEVTTVGGNEADGITLYTTRIGSDPGVQGYGVAP